jgi:LemA protein
MALGIIGYGIIVAAVVILVYILNGWIKIYNKFVYWRTRADRAFSDIDIIMQQRIDMLPSLAQVAKKYSIHEYKAIENTIEARSRWIREHPKASMEKKLEASQEIENNFIKIHVIFEKYPELKADKLYLTLMGSDGSITRVERKLREFRLHYNKIAQDYNERVQRFPRNIVAKVHGFHTINYLTMGNQINQGPQKPFKPTELFDD